MPQPTPKRKSRPRTYMMRVIKGGFEPADSYTKLKLRERNYALGDLVCCTFHKMRNPGFHRLAHQIGCLVVENIESFKNSDAHTALKRIQIEGGIGCDEIGIMIPGLGSVIQRIPRSLSFENMDESEFRDIVKKMCDHISANYWPDLNPAQIEQMADCFVID